MKAKPWRFFLVALLSAVCAFSVLFCPLWNDGKFVFGLTKSWTLAAEITAYFLIHTASWFVCRGREAARK